MSDKESKKSADNTVSELLSGMVLNTINGTKGRPYVEFATNGEQKLYINVTYGIDSVKLEKDKYLPVAGMIVRFRGSTPGEYPVPSRKDTTDSLLLKKYFIPLEMAPVNGFTLRDRVVTTELPAKVFNWLTKNICKDGWITNSDAEKFTLLALAVFESLPPSPPAVASGQFPPW
jgi:hypothetical protein